MVRRTKQEAQETRHRILDTAETLFLRQGVSRTSLQQIADAAGLTRGAIYWHFEDKSQLFDAIMERATMPMEQGMGSQDTAPRDLSELRWGLVNIFFLTVNQERTHRAFEISMHKVEYAGELEGLRERKASAHRDWRELTLRCLRHAQEQDQLEAQVDVATAAVALVSLVDGLLHQWITEPEAFDLLAVGLAAVQGFLDSLMPAGHTLPPMSAADRARLGQLPLCPGQSSGKSPV